MSFRVWRFLGLGLPVRNEGLEYENHFWEVSGPLKGSIPPGFRAQKSHSLHSLKGAV